MGEYRTLVVDPPWQAAVGKMEMNVGRPYPYPSFELMSIDELKEFPINVFAAEQSHLYLWAINSTVRRAFDLLDSWGFKFHCLLVWNKSNGFRPVIFSFRTEFVLFGYRGLLRQRTEVLWIPSNFTAKTLGWARKPDKLYQIAETVSLPPRVDIFSRKGREGWDIWGKEAECEGRSDGEEILGLPILKEIKGEVSI